MNLSNMGSEIFQNFNKIGFGQLRFFSPWKCYCKVHIANRILNFIAVSALISNLIKFLKILRKGRALNLSNVKFSIGEPPPRRVPLACLLEL